MEAWRMRFPHAASKVSAMRPAPFYLHLFHTPDNSIGLAVELVSVRIWPGLEGNAPLILVRYLSIASEDEHGAKAEAIQDAVLRSFSRPSTTVASAENILGLVRLLQANGALVSEETRAEMMDGVSGEWAPSFVAPGEVSAARSALPSEAATEASTSSEVKTTTAADSIDSGSSVTDTVCAVDLGRPTGDEPLASCSVCGKKPSNLRCARCKDIVYCTRKCQKSDAETHKKVCAPFLAGSNMLNIKLDPSLPLPLGITNVKMAVRYRLRAHRRQPTGRL
ncbi:uncharacterized protein AMSG_09100 [Thecamonas trahens ATCC 50062]|uniref:MYND-type domain-containing protein n=1 Tax=Thecamonas trahens ATCC 50062 TaxID=461836 RepID=A0A0L0DNE0_THETB|nr:hypothetical protein AMSG_09100 [Thecamonas trahens ATCC 50062]KNC52933.1 hypothetical protein AMSG_09100 [Thecamonas trahens ATCC 50062]|eukprot:XP_013754828.1 hypothetical protein AMSG_09100 [Thecamonas trahens ATCC 50062]